MAVIFIIGMSDTLAEHRYIIIHQLVEEACSYGFFIIYNHGISAKVMRNTILAFKRFHEQHMPSKNQFNYLSLSLSSRSVTRITELQSRLLEEEQNHYVNITERLVVRLAPYVESDVLDICRRLLLSGTLTCK